MDINNLPHVFYPIVMGVVLLGWLSLIVFPRRSWANFWFAGVIVPLVLSFVYMYFLLTFWFIPPAGVLLDFTTLRGVYKMFGNSGLLLVAWINIIAMDLVVGAWMARKAEQVRMPYIYLLPCLIVTFVFAGFGFSLFVIITAIAGRWQAIAKVESVPATESQPVAARVA